MALTVPAQAAPDSEENFVRSRAYSGQFSDLTTASVFYDNVAALYEYGLSVGRADGTYGIQDPMTVGEIVIFAGRIRSLYRTGDAERGPDACGGDGSPAAGRYLRYLQAEEVLGAELDGSFLSDEACDEGWFTGSMAGICCQDLTGFAKYADFDWFEIRNCKEIT